jgi:excisionase family DNA binding protein
VKLPVRQLELNAVVTLPMLLTVAHAAEVLDCSTRTVRRRIADGALPAVIEAGRLMVRGDELLAYIEALERPRAPRRRARASRPSAGRFDFLAPAATLEAPNKALPHRANGREHVP